MEKDAKIYVAGHRGMVGSAIVRELQRQGYTNLITRTHKELDLTRQDAVEEFFAKEKPEYVFLAAAKVGGIVANESALADFMYDNMILEMNGGRFYADRVSARTGNADTRLQCFTEWTAEINMADLDAETVHAGLEEAALSWEGVQECAPVQGITLTSGDGVTLHLITEETE